MALGVLSKHYSNNKTFYSISCNPINHLSNVILFSFNILMVSVHFELASCLNQPLFLFSRPKPGIANNIELVSIEELVKLKSVFDIIAHWAVDLLKAKTRHLVQATSSCKDANETRDVLLEHTRPLTALIGMLTSQCHIGKSPVCDNGVI